MLTEDEIDSLRIAREELAELGFTAVPRALEAMQERLTSTRAVLDEAERLLRERKASTVRWTKTTVSIDWEDDYRTLADAYEALKEGSHG